MIPAEVRLYSWVDVEDVLIHTRRDGGWPEWLVWARPYWDSLTLGLRPGNETHAKEWLSDKFDPRFDKASNSIILESLQDKPRKLVVKFEDTQKESNSRRFMPSFSRPTVLWKPQEYDHPASLPSDAPPVVVFHSFKGGVGRTVHALALALALKKRHQSVLLVDGDLEAPGISWLLRSRLPSPPISFVDFLALIHGDPEPSASYGIELAANKLKDALIDDSIYIMPAFRSLSQLNSVEIKPEHLALGSEDPFILTKMLIELGKVLEVDTIIVDLRAGISELSAGLLLDPRIYRVLVTTLSSQSFEGTKLLLKLIGELAPPKKEEEPLPAIILSQVPEEFQDEEKIDSYLELLWKEEKDFLKFDGENDEGEELPIQFLTPFDSNLVVLPESWDEVVKRVTRSDLIEKMSVLTQWLPELSSKITNAVYQYSDLGDLKNRRSELAQYAEELIYAEKGKIGEFLRIHPLRNLASDFRTKVPIAVIIGAKGSGKTYTFLQIVLRQNWKNFAEDAGVKDVQIDAYVCPVFNSKNLEDPAKKIVQGTREKSLRDLGLIGLYTGQDISYYIGESLKEELHVGEWRDRWLNILAWSSGFKIGDNNAGRTFPEYLRERNLYVVAVIDGLEDLFQYILSDKNEQTAVRALPQDVPEWLEQQPSRPIGLSIFIRQDMVLSAIRQNPAQFISRYDRYALKWNSEEALRLVAWIASKAKALDNPNLENQVEDMDKSDLTNELVKLWGWKLGGERSREARSADWVIATLTVGGQIQARDLVRLLVCV